MYSTPSFKYLSHSGPFPTIYSTGLLGLPAYFQSPLHLPIFNSVGGRVFRLLSAYDISQEAGPNDSWPKPYNMSSGFGAMLRCTSITSVGRERVG